MLALLAGTKVTGPPCFELSSVFHTVDHSHELRLIGALGIQKMDGPSCFRACSRWRLKVELLWVSPQHALMYNKITAHSQ